MYSEQHIQLINLPEIPRHIIDALPCDVNQYNNKYHNDNYTWSNSFNQELNAWCQQHIAKSVYWAFQFIAGDLDIHKDIGTKIKFVYILNNGGSNVTTKFWAEDKTTLLNQYVIPEHAWHLLNADTYHSVEGIESGKQRWAVTGRLF